MRWNCKTIAFYIATLVTICVAMLGPTFGGFLPDGPIDIPLDIDNFRLAVVSFAEGRDLAGGLNKGPAASF